MSLPKPTDDTRQLVKVALWILKQIYKPHHAYVKAGVMLGELVPITGVQQDLFASPALTSSTESTPTQAKSTRLMHAIDSINQKMEKESIKLASEGFKRPWKNETEQYKS